jgi:hypothetical protein
MENGCGPELGRGEKQLQLLVFQLFAKKDGARPEDRAHL